MASHDNAAVHFGLLIAYVLPGFTALQGVPLLSTPPAGWGVEGSPTLTGFLSGTLEAIAAGLTISTIRWLVIDALHHHTGVDPPAWDFARLAATTQAFELLVQVHYRYYKFYANMVVALIVAYATRDCCLGWKSALDLLLITLFFVASRDALKKYYLRAGQLLRGQTIRGVEL